MMKKAVSILSMVVIMVVSITSGFTFSLASAESAEMRNITTMELVRDMGIGINLGNTLEACGDWINGKTPSDYEKAWGSPIVTKEMIEGYKNAGFGVLRIPVAWSNMMENDGNYVINSDYMARVTQVVDWTLDAGLYAIINIHYDNGWVNKFPENENECMKRYEKMWTQICDNFKNYNDYLMFESQNEELGWETLWNKWAGTEGKDESYALVNKINQKFVDVVRNSGGNNDKRHLLISGYNTGIDVTCDSLFKMPEDPAKRCAISVHYYSPPTFAILTEDADWGKCQTTWGTAQEIADLNREMDMMKTTFVDNGIPVIIGEYGCPTEKEGKDLESTRLFLSSVCEAAYSRNMCPVLWDTPGGRYDRFDCKMTDTVLNKKLCEIAGTTIKEPEIDTTVSTVTYAIDELKKNAKGEYIVPLGDTKKLKKAVIDVEVTSSEKSGWYCGGGALTFDSVKPTDGSAAFWSNKSFNYDGGTKKIIITFDGQFPDEDDVMHDAEIACTQALLVDWWHSSEKYPEGGDDVAVEFKGITLYYENSIEITTSGTENKDYVAGDANCDISVDISDVVAVKCFIINSQKYSLSKQGILNADVESGNNGINMQDVLAIQKYVLTIIKALPVNS
ncbi:MAG: cellulase family glycosylhydrolase [Ruminococcus sp.]|nr:cellulase family glycosylhydrolase [Ruminococcus sp.]